MKRFAVILAGVLTAIALFAQLPPGAKPPGEDWVQIFDGKDLSGWHNVGVEQWSVEPDRSVRGKAVTKNYGYLETVKYYRDFQLALRFKCVEMGNSGVYYHTKFKPGTVDVSQGGQFEIDCNINHHTGGVYDSVVGWLVWPAPENETVVRPSEWNEYLLTVDGNRYICRLNGVILVDFTDPNAKFHDGTIALQLHSGGTAEMLFRDIWIRDLTRLRVTAAGR
jgi:hypothetical protein